MKDNLENSRRWHRQAEYDLKEARRSFNSKSFAYAAFFAEQAAQKSLKSYLIFKGEHYTTIHSVGELAKRCAKVSKKFLALIKSAKTLDRHYIITRYPDALPGPAIPAESYEDKEAREAIKIAAFIVRISKSLIK